MLAIRKADGVIEYVKTPEEFRREKLLEFLENLLAKKAEAGNEEAKAILEEIENYRKWFEEKVNS